MLLRLDETFPHLSNAPIVEAVVDLRARPEVSWEEPAITGQLKARLPDYPTVVSQREFQQQVKIHPNSAPESVTHDLGWKGLRLDTADKRHVAQFNRDGFVFSRLQPYEDWEQLVTEARRLWETYLEVARPSQIQRIAVRFINRIELPAQERRFEKYIKPYPKAPVGLPLPFAGFFSQDTLVVPGHPYVVNVVRTLQQPVAQDESGFAVILDIDVQTVDAPMPLQKDKIDKRLTEMRWIKDKVFFGSITKFAVESFK
jgi:uncharacterized protein (TIGR04255 family)